ncbi:hypothetical protein BJ742DRAFT_744152 [Cladochytrium replicatum]|nr:hypothetical protein BJ742DRAFT_744152 [Cladochytrium replicatum]
MPGVRFLYLTAELISQLSFPIIQALPYKFGISLFGNGVDCYRTWELLYLGVIPIVKSSTINFVYAGLPVLVGGLGDLTAELLNDIYEIFKHIQACEVQSGPVVPWILGARGLGQKIVDRPEIEWVEVKIAANCFPATSNTWCGRFCPPPV